MKKLKNIINVNSLFYVMITLISYFSTYFLPYAINFEGELTYSNSIIALAVFAGFMYLLKKSFTKENIQKIKNAFSLGVILSTFLIIGNQIKTYNTARFNDIRIYFSILCFSFIITAILVQIYKAIEKFEKKQGNEETLKLTGKKRYLVIFLILILCWTPIYLAVFPGYFCYDARPQYNQYNLNYIVDLYPPIHTAILGWTVSTFEDLTGNANVGIAIYIITQMTIISACFTYCIAFLEKYKISKAIKIISILYYALFPVVVMFAICSTKDVLFTALLLVDMIIMLEALLDKESFIKSKKLQARFIIITFLTIIFRPNAIYAYIPFLIIFALMLKKKEILISFAIIGILYAFYVGPIYSLLGVPNNYLRKSEALSVPLQQIARVYNYNFDSLEEQDLETIYNYTTKEQLEKYNPKIADEIKDNVDIKQDVGYKEFFKTWFNIGLKNPGIYVDSFLENSLGFWYPDCIINGYSKINGYDTETSYFAANCEEPGTQESKIPFLRDIYWKISRETTIQKIPVLSMFFSIGAMFWGVLICIWYNIYKKRWKIVSIFTIIIFIWGTMLLGPMYLVRYMLILFFAFPLTLAYGLNGNKFEK